MPDNSSKPYEIRANLLHLAREILSENLHVRFQLTKKGAVEGKTLQYTTEDVIAQAEKLYAFVSHR